MSFAARPWVADWQGFNTTLYVICRTSLAASAEAFLKPYSGQCNVNWSQKMARRRLPPQRILEMMGSRTDAPG
jgi:hypothetical protein